MNNRIATRTAEMGEQHVFRLLLRYSIPTTIGSAAFTVYNIVDRVFIGRFAGTDAIAGISITFPVFMICIAIGMMIGIGSGARASLCLGEGRHEDAERILGNAVALFVLFGLTLSILGHILLTPMLHLFGASEATIPYAQSYMRILLCFIAFDFLAMGMNGLLRSEGNSRISMMTLVSGSLLNVVLDYLLIVVFDFGVAGAAWATGISKTFTGIWILLHFTMSKHRALTLRLKNMRLKLRIVGSILHIGISPFIMQFAHSSVIIVMNRSLLQYGGDAAVGAMGAIYSLVMLLIMPTMGLIQGSQPIIGYNYGAKQFKRVRKALTAALLLAFGSAVIGTAVFQLFPGFFLGFFSRGESNLVEIGRHGLRILLLLFPLASIQMIISNYFQATGRPLISIILNMLRQVVLFMFFLVVLPRFFGLTGIWMVMPCSEAFAFFITGAFLLKEMKKLKREG